jgi:hypothetical protein
VARIVWPTRVRSLGGVTFGWVDRRLRGLLAEIGVEAAAVYLFLVLAANRDGVSWYGHGAIGRSLGVDPGDVRRAVALLCALDLVAYEPRASHAADGTFQVLSFPALPAAHGRRNAGPRRISAILPELEL